MTPEQLAVTVTAAGFAELWIVATCALVAAGYLLFMAGEGLASVLRWLLLKR